MRAPLSAHRALDVLESFTIYRLVGRRPSVVHVDDRMNAGIEQAGTRPLWDLVFQEGLAVPGDQIQDRPGGIVLVTRDGQAHPIQLSPPMPRSLETAFTHAERALAADRALAERMMVEGRLVIGPIRRIKPPMTAAVRTTFAIDHPLVINAAAPVG